MIAIPPLTVLEIEELKRLRLINRKRAYKASSKEVRAVLLKANSYRLGFK